MSVTCSAVTEQFAGMTCKHADISIQPSGPARELGLCRYDARGREVTAGFQHQNEKYTLGSQIVWVPGLPGTPPEPLWGSVRTTS